MFRIPKRKRKSPTEPSAHEDVTRTGGNHDPHSPPNIPRGRRMDIHLVRVIALPWVAHNIGNPSSHGDCITPRSTLKWEHPCTVHCRSREPAHANEPNTTHATKRKAAEDRPAHPSNYSFEVGGRGDRAGRQATLDAKNFSTRDNREIDISIKDRYINRQSDNGTTHPYIPKG